MVRYHVDRPRTISVPDDDCCPDTSSQETNPAVLSRPRIRLWLRELRRKAASSIARAVINKFVAAPTRRRRVRPKPSRPLIRQLKPGGE